MSPIYIYTRSNNIQSNILVYHLGKITTYQLINNTDCYLLFAGQMDSLYF